MKTTTVTLYRATFTSYHEGRPRGLKIEPMAFRCGPLTYNAPGVRLFHTDGAPMGHADGWRRSPREAVEAYLRFHSREAASLEARMLDHRAACAAAGAWLTSQDVEAAR